MRCAAHEQHQPNGKAHDVDKVTEKKSRSVAPTRPNGISISPAQEAAKKAFKTGATTLSFRELPSQHLPIFRHF
jgi:hypothetical protein